MPNIKSPKKIPIATNLPALQKITKNNDSFFLYAEYDGKREFNQSKFTLIAKNESNYDNEFAEQKYLFDGIIRPGYTSTKEKRIYNAKTFYRYTESYLPTNGIWQLPSTFPLLINMLSGNINLMLEVRLDEYTNQLLMQNDLHGDALCLKVISTDGTMMLSECLMDIMICQHDVNRFGEGINATHAILSKIQG